MPELTCPKCGVFNDTQDTACWKCKTTFSDDLRKQALEEYQRIEAEELKTKQEQDLLNSQKIDNAKATGDWSGINLNVIEKAASEIILTTSFQLANRDIERELEIITAECVYGVNLFRDVFINVRDIFGGRSKASQKVLRDARKTALTELKREALMIGADAVIAVDLDYQELSPSCGGPLLMLVASGTAVSIKK